MKVEDILNKMDKLKVRITLCDEVLHYTNKLKDGEIEAIGYDPKQSDSIEINDLIKYLDEYRLSALSEIDRIKKVEVPVGRISPKRRTRPTAKR